MRNIIKMPYSPRWCYDLSSLSWSRSFHVFVAFVFLVAPRARTWPLVDLNNDCWMNSLTVPHNWERKHAKRTSVWRRDTAWDLYMHFSSVQLLSRVQLFATPWTAAHQAFLSITSSWSLLKLMSIEFVMPSNHLILCRSLLLLPSIFPSIRVFSNESVLRIR